MNRLSAFLALCLATTVTLGLPSKLPKDLDLELNIINGEDAEKGEFPWQVSLQLPDNRGNYRHICGGSIISSDRIVTAAHCIHGLPIPLGHMRVVAGAHKIEDLKEDTRQVRKLKAARIHENFHASMFIYNDIGYLQMTEAFEMNSHVQAIAACNAKPSEGDMVITSGWGNANPSGNPKEPIMPETLQKLTLVIPSDRSCKIKFPFALRSNMVCANRKQTDIPEGACNGDSGGPLIHKSNGSQNYCLSGIVSFGKNPCGIAPSIYTSVADFKDWLGL